MSGLLERLQRLRRQAGVTDKAGNGAGDAPKAVAPANAPALRASAPVPLQRPLAPVPAGAAASPSAELARLRRLLDLRPARSVALRGEDIATGLFSVEQQLPDLAPAALLPPRWPDGYPVAAARFLCFDTETTGLAGGAGTRAFMIGAADWHGGGLRVRQLYLSAMSGEAAMLAEFARWLSPERVLVSYNGRSYDAPLLATRYRLQRLSDPIRQCSHVDLLHPVRRAYRGRWENCRLATIERRLLHILREDDLPGSEAPAAWRSWLRQGLSTNLLRVLDHNRQDVVTLARLLRVMAGEEALGQIGASSA
jgi:uncharacterized protein YprB with RNaseH-like and TPR domain